MNAIPVELATCTHDRGGFSRLNYEAVLLYWPHGFGDWVQFSLVLPYLEKSNRYWMTRFGDDSVSVVEGHPSVRPVYSGVNSPHCDDGGAYGLKHFGMNYDLLGGQRMELQVPPSLYDVIRREQIGSVLWTWYPETHGHMPPPLHTKARSMARCLVESLPADFAGPLRRSVCLDVDPLIGQIVEARLKNVCGFGERRLCLLGRGGYTSVGKNWGHQWREDLPEGRRAEGQECRDFIRMMLAKSDGWCFLLMEDRAFADSLKDSAAHTFAYADVFGEPEHAVAPFGVVMKSLVKLASLCVGVPAGPYHLAAQVESLPTIGVWIEHLPSWYDEPRDGLAHVIGSVPAARLTDDASPGSFLSHGKFKYEASVLDSRYVPASAVMGWAEKLLGTDAWRAGPTIATPKRRGEFAEHHDRVDHLLEQPAEYPAGRFEGKGIVIPGGGRYWPSAWVALKRLRASGCVLPVQLWYLGPGEMGAVELSLAASLDVQCVDGLEVRRHFPARILNGWELKPYSIIHSRFAQVLLLDSDNVVVRDPSDLFDSSGYKEHGALFWPDRGSLAPDRKIWAACRVPYRQEPEFDSGQMVIDKLRSWRPLQLAMHFNEYSDFYYQHMLGDKDSYHLAWRYLGQPYGMIGHPLRHIDDVFHQHDESGKKTFQHGVKWSLTEPHRFRRAYLFQDECIGYLNELASQMRRPWRASDEAPHPHRVAAQRA